MSNGTRWSASRGEGDMYHGQVDVREKQRYDGWEGVTERTNLLTGPLQMSLQNAEGRKSFYSLMVRSLER